MTSEHVVIGARKWATHYEPSGGGAPGVLYGFFTREGFEDAYVDVYRHVGTVPDMMNRDVLDIDCIDHPLAYPSRHVVDP